MRDLPNADVGVEPLRASLRQVDTHRSAQRIGHDDDLLLAQPLPQKRDELLRVGREAVQREGPRESPAVCRRRVLPAAPLVPLDDGKVVRKVYGVAVARIVGLPALPARFRQTWR